MAKTKPKYLSEFNVGTNEKTTPADDDRILIDDSEDSYAKKWVTHASLIGSAVASYAELYEDNESGTLIELDTSGTWYKWVSSSAGNDTGASLALADAINDKIIIGASGSGPYFVEAFFAGIISSAAELSMAVFLDGTKAGGGLETSDAKGSGQSLDLSCSGIVDLANTNYLEVKFKSNQTNLDLTVKRLNISIFRMAGGRDGNRWHSGSGAPAGGLGNINDHYLDTANGNLYVKTGDTTWTADGNIKGPTGDTGDTGAQGDPGLAWEGAWDSGTSYAIDDAVTHNGSSYVCTQAHSNQEPPNASYWDLLASKGDAGTPSPMWFLEQTSLQQTSSATPVLVPGMTITPAAGTYKVVFGGTGYNGSKGSRSRCCIYSGGTEVESSRQDGTAGGINYSMSFSCAARVTVNGSQAIEGRMGSPDSGTTYVEVCNMTITPVSIPS